MASFTQLGREELAALAREFSLGALSSFSAIEAGTINSNYQLQTEAGTFFLRVNEGKSRDEVEYEIAVLEHLAAAGVPTPLPIQAGGGTRYASHAGKFISVFPWQVGGHVDSKSISESQCHAMGRSLAELHKAGAGMGIETGGRYTFADVRRAYDEFATSTDPELQEALAVLADEFRWLEERQASRQELEQGLIHADLFPDNVLLDDGNVVALLDFEQACVGGYCYDLAVTMNAWCFAEALVPTRAAAMVRGYLEGRTLSPSERSGLAVELRAAALRFVVTRIRDVHIPQQAGGGAVGQEGGKDFRRFLMRLRTWQAMDAQSFADLAKGTVPS